MNKGKHHQTRRKYKLSLAHSRQTVSHKFRREKNSEFFSTFEWYVLYFTSFKRLFFLYFSFHFCSSFFGMIFVVFRSTLLWIKIENKDYVYFSCSCSILLVSVDYVFSFFFLYRQHVQLLFLHFCCRVVCTKYLVVKI